MAIDFNGTTSRIAHTTQTGFDVAQMTVLAWAIADGQGEGGFGRIFQADDADTASPSPGLLHNNSADTIRWYYDFAGGGSADGQWTFPATDGQWNAISVTYNRGATTNDPVARVNFASATITEVVTPVGSASAPNNGYCIGNNADSTRTWDGGLMHVQFHPTILSADDQDKANQYPGSVRTEGALWWPLLNGTYTKVFLVSGGVWTVTNAATLSNCATRNPKPPCRPRRLISVPSLVRADHGYALA